VLRAGNALSGEVGHDVPVLQRVGGSPLAGAIWDDRCGSPLSRNPPCHRKGCAVILHEVDGRGDILLEKAGGGRLGMRNPRFFIEGLKNGQNRVCPRGTDFAFVDGPLEKGMVSEAAAQSQESAHRGA
jgi:hypothetical protein